MSSSWKKWLGVLLLAALIISMSSCDHDKRPINTPLPGKKLANPPAVNAEYRIGPEDIIQVSVWQEESLDAEVMIRPDGKFSFPLTGDIPAVGLTCNEVQQEVTKKLQNYIKYPVVSVSLKKIGGKKIIVLGEVEAPGVYNVMGNCTILEAISRAGGYTNDAVLSSTMLVTGGFENPQGRILDLTKIMSEVDMSQNVVLNHEDIVYVPRKFIADMNYTLTQIIIPLSHAVYVKDNIGR